MMYKLKPPNKGIAMIIKTVWMKFEVQNRTRLSNMYPVQHMPVNY